MNYLVHSFELGLNWGGPVCKFFQKLGGPGPPQAPMDGTPMASIQLPPLVTGTARWPSAGLMGENWYRSIKLEQPGAFDSSWLITITISRKVYSLILTNNSTGQTIVLLGILAHHWTLLEVASAFT